MPNDQLPWLDYEGQETAQILACQTTHSIASLLCALKDGLQLRRDRYPEIAETPEETTFMACMALDREVNNGGYDQFFRNSSGQYALNIVDALKSIGCLTTAGITEKAIAALNLSDKTLSAIETSLRRRSEKRDQALEELDQEFYGTFEIEDKLFEFVQSRPQALLLSKMDVPPPERKRGNENLLTLGVYLHFPPPELSFESVRKRAEEISIERSMSTSAQDLDAAAYQFLFKTFVSTGDLEQCEIFAGPAFELAREDTSHLWTQLKWVGKLIEASRFDRADEITLEYLAYLNGDDTSSEFIKNRIGIWPDLLRKHPAQLPKSIEYFLANFPEYSLDEEASTKVEIVKPKEKRTSPKSKKRSN